MEEHHQHHRLVRPEQQLDTSIDMVVQSKAVVVVDNHRIVVEDKPIEVALNRIATIGFVGNHKEKKTSSRHKVGETRSVVKDTRDNQVGFDEEEVVVVVIEDKMKIVGDQLMDRR
jgi:hypothetical protein